ncbi:MAG: aldo/keto reductase [Myxococcaceae bacterium]
MTFASTFDIGGDLRVQRLGFGAMRVTGEGIWGEPKDPAAAKALLRRVVELGVDFIDTADAYGPEVSERLLAEALFPYPKGLVIATKGGLLRGGPGQWRPNCQPAHLRAACEASLKRLRQDRIDLYQLHAVDPRVPIEESVGELVRLQGEGKIRHIGLSNVSVAELEKARRLATIVSVQNRYSLLERHSEDVLAACEKSSIGFIPWYPLAMGEVRQNAVIEKVAKSHRATNFQVALAWLLQKSPVMLPIPGTSSRAHLEENCGAAKVSLTDEETRSLSAVAKA